MMAVLLGPLMDFKCIFRFFYLHFCFCLYIQFQPKSGRTADIGAEGLAKARGSLLGRPLYGNATAIVQPNFQNEKVGLLEFKNKNFTKQSAFKMGQIIFSFIQIQIKSKNFYSAYRAGNFTTEFL